ncbi:MAG: FtsQ-type POTRA domain-containing protein [Gammaproteobacteria bacterium]|nr:FtsQ-type POTRA domain-containing protein [Gammaproteobacteria bacterium]MCY4218145.1 FtsQ-type POTRA domain-containing protein [Gammaproteobacteria bacterium]
MNSDQQYGDLFIEPKNDSRFEEPVMVNDDENSDLFIESAYEEPEILSEPKSIRLWVKIMLFITALIVPLGLIYAVDQRYIQDRFLFTQITVKNEFKSRGSDQIREIALSELDGNFFSANLRKLEHQITKISWIPSVSAHRKWPSSLVISVAPINPVARWNDGKWINYTGEVLDIPPFIETHEIAHLPVLTGPPGEELELFESYLDWSEKFAAWGLSLVSLTADDVHVWHLELLPGALSKTRTRNIKLHESTEQINSPTRMVVNQQNAKERILRFVASLDRNLIDRFEEIASIDLRYTNGFAIRWKDEEEALAMRESG